MTNTSGSADVSESTLSRLKSAMEVGSIVGKLTRIAVIVSFLVVMFLYDVNEQFLAGIGLITVCTVGVLWIVDNWRQ